MNIPECFCPGPDECDWVFDFKMSYHRKGEKPGANSSCQWSTEDIPQFLAQLMFQGIIASTNKQGFDIYMSWLEKCIAPQDEIGAMTEDKALNFFRDLKKNVVS